MDWTVGTFGTVGNDALDAGDCLTDAGDSWERRRGLLTDYRPCETSCLVPAQSVQHEVK